MIFRQTGNAGQFIHRDVLPEVVPDVKQYRLNVVFQYIGNWEIFSGLQETGKELLENSNGLQVHSCCMVVDFFVHPWFRLVDVWVMVRKLQAGIDL